MAYFEQLGKKLSDAGQGVAQQTRNFAEVTRLNNTISEKEKAIFQLFVSIGQAYYERHKNNAEAEELQNQGSYHVITLYSEVKRCRVDIKQIRGVFKCADCGADVGLNSVIYSFCRAKMSQDIKKSGAPNGIQVCPSCHSRVEKGNAFCNYCGTKL